jgi:hypothetical protein
LTNYLCLFRVCLHLGQLGKKQIDKVELILSIDPLLTLKYRLRDNSIPFPGSNDVSGYAKMVTNSPYPMHKEFDTMPVPIYCPML